MLFWLWHSVPDDVGDALKAAVTPEPGPAGQIGSHRRAATVGAVATGACSPSNLAMKDFIA
jgi:hypothetical protein